MNWKVNKHVIIPEGTKLSERMFQYNNIVETITLPDNITYLPEYFCFGCKNLKAVFGGRNVKVVSYNTFENCSQLHHLDFMPQIGYKVYDRFSKVIHLKIVRELRITDFCNSYSMNDKQYGYVLRSQNNEYLIWNITTKKICLCSNSLRYSII